MFPVRDVIRKRECIPLFLFVFTTRSGRSRSGQVIVQDNHHRIPVLEYRALFHDCPAHTSDGGQTPLMKVQKRKAAKMPATRFYKRS